MPTAALHRPIPDLWRTVLVAVLTMLAFGAATAAAAPTTEAEPNDNRFQENGPISVDGAQGVLQTKDDRDLFLVRLRPQRQVVVTYTVSGCPTPTAPDFWLDTADGHNIGAPAYSYASVTGDTPRSYTITTPGVVGGPTVDYHLGFSASGYTASVGCAYTFRITGVGGTGTDAIDAAPGPQYPVSATGEPNDIDSQAVGPLSGDTVYTGSIDTANDLDEFWVPVKANTGLTVELSAVSGQARMRIYSRAEGSDSSSETSVSVDGIVDTASVSAGSSDVEYLIVISGAVGAQWRFRLTPPASIGYSPVIPTPAPTPTPVVEPTYTRAATSTTIAYKSRRYRGRVTSAATGCYRGVKVQLRKKGKGSKSYGTTVTRQDGTWTIRRRKVRGKMYAYVAGHTSGYYRCLVAKSRSLR